jgi:polyisoprenoid-binding protein YceI
MKMSPKLLLLLIGIGLHLLTAPPTSSAQSFTQETCTLDPATSQVNFTLGGVIHTVHGTFHLEEGRILFERTTGNMSGTIIVSSTSGNSGNATRDRRMTSEVLKAQSFPKITFEPTHFSGALPSTGKSVLTVEGVFALIGIPHNVKLPMTVQVLDTHCEATGSISIPYTAWGLKDPSTLMLRVEKEVQIGLVLSGTLQR